jgi:tetratricopeptide (TPR) repeat protein
MEGWQCVCMENFGARDAAPLDVCLKELRACDLFIGLIGHYHGSQPPGEEPSFTECEYDDALARDMPRLIFLANKGFPVSSDLWEGDAKRSRQQALRDRVGQDRTAALFTEEADRLATRVVEALHNLAWDSPSSPVAEAGNVAAAEADFGDDFGEVADFTGRGDELDKIIAALSGNDGGAVAITALRGMGGVGKTTLAHQAAGRLRERFPDGLVAVDMRGQSPTPLDVRGALTEAARRFKPQAPEPADEQAAVRLYRLAFSGKRALVLFDNAPGGAELRCATPPAGCGLLVTAREPVFLHDNAVPVPVGLLPREDSVKLLRSAGRGRDDVDEEGWDAIAKACGDLPLALRVAGVYLALHEDVSAADYLADLEERRPEALKLGDDPERDVLAVLGLSVDRLMDDFPALAAQWRELAVFPGDFDREAAAAVWQSTPDETRRNLSKLFDRALLLYDKAKQRYRQHDLFRRIARDGAEPEKLDAAHLRHAQYFTDVLKQAGALYQQGHENVLRGLKLLDRETHNIVAAMDWAIGAASKNRAAQQVVMMLPAEGANIIRLRLQPAMLLGWHTAGVEAANALKQLMIEGFHWQGQGIALRFLGRFGDARVCLERALDIARRQRNAAAEASTIIILGVLLTDEGQYHAAIVPLNKALTIFQRTGHKSGLSDAIGNLGFANQKLGNHDKALDYYRRLQTIFAKTGDRHGESLTHYNFASTYAEQGRIEDAIKEGEKSLKILEELGAPETEQARNSLAEWRDALAAASPGD